VQRKNDKNIQRKINKGNSQRSSVSDEMGFAERHDNELKKYWGNTKEALRTATCFLDTALY
jgi:hypothetical protein